MAQKRQDQRLTVPGPIRLIAIDIDHTLTKDDGTISDENLAAVRRVRAAGRHIVLASTRPPFGVDQVADLLGGESYRISYAGGVIRGPTGEEMRRLLLDIDIAWDILRFAAEHKIDPVIYIDDKAYHRELENQEGGVAEEPPQDAGSILSSVVEILAGGKAPTLIGVTGHEQASLVYDYYLREYQDRLKVWRFYTPEGKYAAIVLVNPEAEKGPALRYIRLSLGIPPEEVLAIGDSESDLGMFKEAGTTVAVGNAVPEVQAAAGIVAPSNEEDGVAWALQHLLP